MLWLGPFHFLAIITVFGFILQSLDFCMNTLQRFRVAPKHKREIDSLKRENLESRGTIMLSRMVILFLGAVLLIASRKTT